MSELMEKIRSLFRKREPDCGHDEWDDYLRFTRRMSQEGWQNWQFTQPPGDRLLRLCTKRGVNSNIIYRDDLHPMTNVCGLYWKPWDGLTIEAQQIVGPMSDR